MVAEHVRVALRGVDTPVGVIDRDALDQNAAALCERAQGAPIRVASKSVRVPQALERVLRHPGFRGIFAFTLSEALTLYREGFRDILVGYPSVQRTDLRDLADDAGMREAVTLMIDSVEHLRYLQEAVGRGPAVGNPPVRLCMDVDASLKIGEKILGDRVHVGVRRSPVHTVDQARALVREIQSAPGFRLVGIMSYEGQIAGIPNGGSSPRSMAIRAVQKASARDLKRRRTAIIAAVRAMADLEFVNGGGTGSLESSVAEGSLTEVAAGSGLFSPGFFDRYRYFRHHPAAFFATPVVRRPGPGWVTVYGGGFMASGPPSPKSAPVLDWPQGLSFSPREGVGEVQTPLRGRAADGMRLGDLVYFRHAKAGELSERVAEYLVVSQGEIVETWPTYRGKGWVF